MTAEHLEQWRALADAATPGPWLPSHNVDAPSDGNWEPDNPEREGRGEGPTLTGLYRDVKAWAEADAAFIAAAREAVPALIAEVERLQAAWSAEHDAYIRADEQTRMAEREADELRSDVRELQDRLSAADPDVVWID